MPDDTARCVTCGRQEAPSATGNCRLAADRPPILLPQTSAAETAQRLIVEMDASDREDHARRAAEFAEMAADIRRRANLPTHAELVQRRTG